MLHELKCWPAYFEAVVSGQKTFEIRYDKDRGFQAGDRVFLREYDPNITRAGRLENNYTGQVATADIGYVTAFEQKEGFVVFSLLNLRMGKP